MPLLSKIMTDSRSQSNAIRANVRYCNSANCRHSSSGGIICSFACPSITALVPTEQRHRRFRSGMDCIHYSFNAIQTASLSLRLAKRYESIENDRQENIVDVLNDIAHTIRDDHNLLERVVTQVSSEGTVCSILQQICDAFKASMISESPQMEVLAENTDEIKDFASKQLIETQSLTNELVALRNDISRLLEAVVDKSVTEMTSLRAEVQLLTTAVERMDANSQMNGLDLKQELVETRHEISGIGEQVHSLKDIIIDILPKKLVELFNGYASEQSSEAPSDIVLIDSQRLEEINEMINDSNILNGSLN